MTKAIIQFAASALLLIGLLSFVALHIEAFIYTGFAMPSSILPIDALRGRGISLGLVIAAGLGAALHTYLFKRLIVQRWQLVSEEHFSKLTGTKASQ